MKNNGYYLNSNTHTETHTHVVTHTDTQTHIDTSNFKQKIHTQYKSFEACKKVENHSKELNSREINQMMKLYNHTEKSKNVLLITVHFI